MDKLSIFSKESGEVTLTSEGDNTLDSVVNELKDIGRELLIQRKGQEAGIYGEPVEEMEDVDLEDIPEKEVDNG